MPQQPSFPPLPTTKAELLARMARGRADFEAIIANLSDAQLSAPDKDGWAIKDHLVHLAVWELGIAAMLRRQPRYRAMGIEQTEPRGGNFDEPNEKIFQQHHNRALPEVLEYFRMVHLDLIAAINALSDADLQKTYSYYQPDDPGDDSGEPIVRWIVGNSYGHYAEHAEWIRAMLEKM